MGMPIFINARTDVFLKTYPAEHTREQLEEVILRAEAYKTFLAFYGEDVTVLSRDWTMRDREEIAAIDSARE